MRKIGLFAGILSAIVLAVMVPGCVTDNGSKYVSAEEAGVMTVALDDHDYDMVVKGVSQALFSGGLRKGYVVVLGPVETKDCPYDVRVVSLQKSLQASLGKQGAIKFFSAIDAISGSVANKADGDAGQIYKLIEYNWNNKNPIDKEAMQKFGKMADIGGILFGRVSSLERPLSNGGKEITYRFVWELANTATGITDVTHEEKIRKHIAK
ncbi:MAG: hypothetical protein WCN95_13780 [bacterium]